MLPHTGGDMAAVTPLGRFLRKVRIDEHELLKDMATKLDVSVAQLSAIELGKRSINTDVVTRIKEVYKKYINDSDFDEVVEMSQPSQKIDARESDSHRELLVTFARKYVELSDDKATALLEKIKMI